MPTLVVVRKGNKAVIGADTLSIQDSTRLHAQNRPGHQAIHQLRTSYIGFVGAGAIHNAFEAILQKHPQDLNFQSRAQVYEAFLFLRNKIREEHLPLPIDQAERAAAHQWEALVANPSGVYHVGKNGEVTDLGRYWAIGTGAKFALGGLHATYDAASDPEIVAIAGLHAACELDPSSSAPVTTRAVALTQ